MKFQGTVLNAQTQMPLPGVKILALISGKCTQLGTTDAGGRYLVNAPRAGTGIGFKIPGFATQVIDQGDLQEDPDILLDPGGSIGSLPGKIPTWVMFAGSAAALGALSSGSRKVSGTDYSKYILPVGLVIGAYFVLAKLGIFGKGSLFDSNANTANNDTITAQVQQGTSQALQDLQTQGQTPTLNNSQLASLAADLYNQGIITDWFGGTTDTAQQVMVNDLAQVQNTADIYALKKTFGTKNAVASKLSSCYLVGVNCQVWDLDSWVKLCLNAGNVADINGLYNSRGIAYQF
jgi:hypothetical protein